MTAHDRKEKACAQTVSPCRSGDESLPCCAILESMTDGVFTVDLDRRINTFFNRAAEAITGFSFAEAAGQFCFDILRSSTCQLQCPLERTLQTGEPVYNHRMMPRPVLWKEPWGVHAPRAVPRMEEHVTTIRGSVAVFPVFVKPIEMRR